MLATSFESIERKSSEKRCFDVLQNQILLQIPFWGGVIFLLILTGYMSKDDEL